jgi:hypothetical protein
MNTPNTDILQDNPWDPRSSHQELDAPDSESEFYPMSGEPKRTIVGGEMVITHFPDGSAAIEPINDNNGAMTNQRRHHKENLALILSDNELREIGGTLKDAVADDIGSQSDFFKAVAHAIELMGLDLDPTVDQDNMPFDGASMVYSSKLFETLQSLAASIQNGIFKGSGMVDTCIIGTPSDQLDDIASRMKDWFNYYFDYVAKEFRKEAMQAANWALLAGSAYKKVYICPVLKRPISQPIPIEDFIVNNVYSSHLTAPRRTHILRLSEKDFRTRVLMGLYRDISISKQSDDGSNNADNDVIREQLNKTIGYDPVGARSTDDTYVIYEVHADLCIEGDDTVPHNGIPFPYIVSLDEESGQVLRISRNWKEGDSRRQRIEYFVNYFMFTALRGSGYGLVHYASKLAEAATSLERQLINAALYANFPGGVYQQGIRLENNNLSPAPGEFVPIMCSGPVGDAIQPLPYKEPSPALNELRKDIEESIGRPAAILDQKIADMPMNAPVGTTLAIFDHMHTITSVIMQNFYESLTRELELYKERFPEWLGDRPYPFKVVGGDRMIVRQDFEAGVNVMPSADPNTRSSAHRFMVSELVLNNAKASPDIYNVKYANEVFLKNMNVPAEDIEKLLNPQKDETPPPQPMDPVSTMMAIIKGEPVTAAVWQDHAAYISILDSWIQSNPQDPHLQNAMALKTQYEAYKYMVDAYAALGMQPPEDPSQLTPEQQNQLAIQIAHIKLQEAQQAQAGQQPPEPPLDPARVELEAAQMEAKIAHEKNELEFKKIEISKQKMDMEYQLNVKEFELKTQIQHLKSEMDSFKIAHEQAIKERDQALKEKDTMLEEAMRQNVVIPDMMAQEQMMGV